MMRIGILVFLGAILVSLLDVAAQDDSAVFSIHDGIVRAQGENAASGVAPGFGPSADDESAFPKFWGKAEFLYWWSKDSPAPVPMVTRGNSSDATPGAIGQPGTRVLIGNTDLDVGGRPGGRFTLGFSFDREQTWGLEGTYFLLASESASQWIFSNGAPGSQALWIPFIDANSMQADVTRLAAPGSFSGAAHLRVTNSFQGAEANVLHELDDSTGVRIDLLAGFRYLNLNERLTFATSSPNVFPNPPDVFQTYDRFSARNDFYGGQLGLRAGFENDWWFVNATGKLALGGTRQSVSVDGATMTNAYGGNGTVVIYPGGYFAQSTNIGWRGRTEFAVVPQIDLNVGARLTPWANVFAGYTFLYASSVARPGEQIDRVINPTQAVAINGPDDFSGAHRPVPIVDSTDFWIQGLNVGLELRY